MPKRKQKEPRPPKSLAGISLAFLSSTEGFAFLRDKKAGKPGLVVEYGFSIPGKNKIACSVQDDQGGERTGAMEVEVK